MHPATTVATSPVLIGPAARLESFDDVFKAELQYYRQRLDLTAMDNPYRILNIACGQDPGIHGIVDFFTN
ncbi:MAG: hypothetical protein O3C63_03460 [Cyanobacteria bacterium]|nr:hypothetical protein [Cyanobacteriota bacterium]MDA1020364.1 hypothetical protein [Cyanobacteriota bacterium]